MKEARVYTEVCEEWLFSGQRLSSSGTAIELSAVDCSASIPPMKSRGTYGNRQQYPEHQSETPNGFSGKTLAATAVLSGLAAVVLNKNFFEFEKKVTHAIELDYGVEDSEFARTISHLLGPPLLEGNEVYILENGARIFPAMLAGIRAAQVSVTFENFVFTSGRIASQFAEAFAERARAGVKVHILQDAVGCDCVKSKEMQMMREAGVEVEIFRYWHLRFNERTHRKLLTIDGKVGFIGGVGISDLWDGDGDNPDVWRDTQYLVQGPVVSQMQQAFMDNWIQTRATVLHGDTYFPELPEKGGLSCQAFSSSANEGSDGARLMFLFSMAAARKSIRIANAYFIPDDLCIETIVKAAERGVQVEIIVPSKLTDQPTVCLAGRARWRSMLKAGVRFYEFMPAKYHCKYMIIDDRWTTVGSCNFDNRSLRLNEETNLNVLDHGFAREHIEIFEKDKSHCREVTFEEWKNRPFKDKMQGLLGCLFRSQI